MLGRTVRASRLVSMIILLQVRGRMTAEALAEELEVSVRTVYRDVEGLSAAGIPVFADRGPGGGFALLDGYRTRLTGLAGDEAEALFMIGLPGPAAALGLGPAASGAAGKLLASLPSSLTSSAGRIGSRFHLDPVAWYQTADTTPHLPALARAVLDTQVVTIRYESWTGPQKWRIEPLGLVLKAGDWYVVARSRGSTRMFKVAQIVDQVVQRTVFEWPVDFDLASWWAGALQRFEQQLRPGIAIVRASPEGCPLLAALGAHAAAAVRTAGNADAHGWAEVHLPIETIEQAATQLLSLGTSIEVVDPPELRQRISDLAQAIARRHRTDHREPSV
jgi:predicted DNA-binding transcriptional regulator YafY